MLTARTRRRTARILSGNVEKCLAAGFDEVVLLFLHRGTLGKVRQAVGAKVNEKERRRQLSGYSVSGNSPMMRCTNPWGCVHKLPSS